MCVRACVIAGVCWCICMHVCRWVYVGKCAITVLYIAQISHVTFYGPSDGHWPSIIDEQVSPPCMLLLDLAEADHVQTCYLSKP